MVKITSSGLIAGDKYLREHSEEFDNGTAHGERADFIAGLLSEIFHASHVAFELPRLPLELPPRSGGLTHQAEHE